MAVTLENITAMLTIMELEYEVDDSRIIEVINAADQISLFIDVQEEGKFISIQALFNTRSGFLKIPTDHIYINELLKYLMKQNYRYKIGQWGYDREDGDIRFIVNYALEDGVLTQMQFERFIRTTLQTVEDEKIVIANILKTGMQTMTEAERLKIIIAKAASLINEDNFLDVQELLEKISVDKTGEAIHLLRQLETPLETC